MKKLILFCSGSSEHNQPVKLTAKNAQNKHIGGVFPTLRRVSVHGVRRPNSTFILPRAPKV